MRYQSRLKLLCEKLELTQREFSAILGIYHGTFFSSMARVKELPVEHFVRIYLALDTGSKANSAEWLYRFFVENDDEALVPLVLSRLRKVSSQWKYDNTFGGKVLAMARMQHYGLDAKELSQRLGLAYDRYRRAERGESRLSMPVFRAIVGLAKPEHRGKFIVEFTGQGNGSLTPERLGRYLRKPPALVAKPLLRAADVAGAGLYC